MDARRLRCFRIGSAVCLPLLMGGCAARPAPSLTEVVTTPYGGMTLVAALAVSAYLLYVLIGDANREAAERLPAWLESISPLKGRWLKYAIAGLGVTVLFPLVYAGCFLACLVLALAAGLLTHP